MIARLLGHANYGLWPRDSNQTASGKPGAVHIHGIATVVSVIIVSGANSIRATSSHHFLVVAIYGCAIPPTQPLARGNQQKLNRALRLHADVGEFDSVNAFHFRQRPITSHGRSAKSVEDEQASRI